MNIKFSWVLIDSVLKAIFTCFINHLYIGGIVFVMSSNNNTENAIIEEFEKEVLEHSLSQISIATTTTNNTYSTTATTARLSNFISMDDLMGNDENKNNNINDDETQSLLKESAFSKGTFPGMTIDEKHTNYVLMYDMLTGIRISVSICQAKPPKEINSYDYTESIPYAFDSSGNQFTPSSKYEFKFKDYSPWVFRILREAFKIDAADYLVFL